MMKKIPFMVILIILLLAITGCQGLQDEATKLRSEGEKTIQGASEQIESAKKEVIDTKTHIDEKVKEAQDVTDAVKKFSE